MRFFQRPSFLTISTLSMLLLTSCSNKAERGPGLCKLSCGSSVIGDSKYKVLAPEAEEYECSTQDGIDQREIIFTLFFSIEKPDRNSATAGAMMPAPHISITPTGLRTGVGLLTEEGDLCSDACGTTTLTYQTNCPAPGKSVKLKLGIRSGSMTTESPTEFNITTLEEEE